MEELPGELEGDEGFAGAGGEREQDALVAGGNAFEYALDGDALVVARGIAAIIGERRGGEAVAPGVFFGEGRGPEFVGRGKGSDLAFRAGFHIDLIEAGAVGGVGEARLQLCGVDFSFAKSFGERRIALLGFDDAKRFAAIDQRVVGDVRLAAQPRAQQAALRDAHLAREPAILDHAPTRRPQRRIDQLGACLSLVHGATRTLSPERGRGQGEGPAQD